MSKRKAPIFTNVDDLLEFERARKMVKSQHTQGSSQKKSQKKRKLQTLSRFGNKAERSPEVKVFDTSVNTNLSQTGGTTCLNTMVLGSDSNNRIGRKVELKHVNVKLEYFNAHLASVTQAPSETFRVSLVYDRQSDGANVAYTDVYSVNGSINAPYATRNINNIDRFVVLKDWVLNLNSSLTTTQLMEHYCAVSHDTRYNGTNGGTYADISTGGLWLVYASDNAVMADEGQLNGYCRVAYADE